ncbi:MAG: hypothetical protein KatS3mg022_1042 [Armatimonadota bacterium]|nr:MAG: hypothetical protein KatS3mg022_1042 [Armatimonadota bacterium]
MRHTFMLTLGIALLLGIVQQPSFPQAGTPITASAVGEAKASPDRVTVYFTLYGQGQTLVEARQAVRNLLQRVTARLASFGVDKRLLKEEVSELVPSVQAGSVTVEATPAASQRHYEASISYSLQMPVSEERLDRLFQILDALSEYTTRPGTVTGTGGYGGGFGSIGATPAYQNIYVEFRVQDMERLKQQAVQDGVAKARKMAETAAKQMGKRQVKMVRLNINDPGTSLWQASMGYTPGSIKWQPLRIYIQVNATFHAQ